MEISAIEALTNAKLEVDRALDKANRTLHRLLEEIPLESEAAPKPQNSIASKTSESTLGYTRAKPTPRISAASECSDHTSFEEDVKDEDVFASTTMTASVKMLLSQATDLRNDGYTLFTANVKTAFLNAQMKGGDVVYAKTATRVAAGNTGSDKKKSDLETTEKSLWPEKRTEPLAGTSGAVPQEVRLRPEHAGHLPVDTHDEYHSNSTWTTCCWLERPRSSKKSSLN